MAMSAWVKHQQMMDQVIDSWFAEEIEIHPWNATSYEGEGGPDPTRKVLKGPNVMACYVTPGARVVGEISDGAAGTGAKQLENDIWASIQLDVLGDPTYYKENDRLWFKDRNEWFEITYIAPSATRRPNIHLVRLQNVDVVQP